MADSAISEAFGKITYLDLHDVEIDLDRTQIIWAPNGVGKTTIYKVLQDAGINLGNVAYLACEDMRKDFAKSAKRTLRLGAHVSEIDDLKNQVKSIVDTCDIKNKFKELGLTTAAAFKKILNGYPQAKDDYEDDLKTFDGRLASQLINDVSPQDSAFFVANIERLKQYVESKEDLAKLKNHYILHSLEALERVVDGEDCVCPVCNAESDKPILETIKEKLWRLEECENSLVIDYANSHSRMSLKEAKENIERLSNISANEKKSNQKAILSLCICGGNPDNVSKMESAKKTIASISKKLEKLLIKRNEFYEKLVLEEDAIKGLICLKLDVSENKVEFDSENKEVVVNLPRNVDTYSTGEISLMMLLVHLYEFRASDTKSLVLDDPITSFDKSNQYDIIFDLVRLNREDGKHITIFTHNTDCINIAQSQDPSGFEYASMDRLGNKVRLKSMGLTPKNNDKRYLCADSIIATTKEENAELYILFSQYAEAVRAREATGSQELHEVFHYNGSSDVLKDQKGNSFDNDYLTNYIDRFDEGVFSDTTFAQCGITKVFTLIALRVWVEKQLYDACHDEPWYKESETQTLKNKIDAVFPSGKEPNWKGSERITRRYLMSKKAMLNQSSHKLAQRAPFEYALNLSINDLVKSVEDLKGHFKEDE